MALIASPPSTVKTVTPAPARPWLRAPLLPGLDRPVRVETVTDEELDQPTGVFRPLGATYPVTVSDVRQAGGYTVRFAAVDQAERAAVLALLGARTTLLFLEPNEGTDPGTFDYVQPVGAVRLDRPGVNGGRYLTVRFVRVKRP